MGIELSDMGTGVGGNATDKEIMNTTWQAEGHVQYVHQRFTQSQCYRLSFS